MVTVQSNDISFMVLLSASVLDGLTWMIEDHRKAWLPLGGSQADVEEALETYKKWCLITRENPDDKKAIKCLKRLGAKKDQWSAIANPHARSFMNRFPAETLRHVNIPVLALFAEGDSCTDPKRNKDPLDP